MLLVKVCINKMVSGQLSFRGMGRGRHIQIEDLGRMDYQQAWDLQKEFQRQCISGEREDSFLLVEHEPVYTLGKNANENHLLQNRPDDTKVFHIERGGDITYHGPGQLVGYPILDLHHYKKSVSWYMRRLELVIMETLSQFGITALPKDGFTGVWVEDEKIAALGVRISRWVTMHGFALNVNTDLDYYKGIIPCGIFEYGVTSMNNLLGKKIDILKVKKVLIDVFLNTFQSREKVGVD